MRGFDIEGKIMWMKWPVTVLAVFMLVLAGGRFTHFDMLPHEHAGPIQAVLADGSHDHTERTSQSQSDGTRAMHCGAPILLPVESIEIKSRCRTELHGPAGAMNYAGVTSGFDPPPPRILF
jgi:hypothetical protein